MKNLYFSKNKRIFILSLQIILFMFTKIYAQQTNVFDKANKNEVYSYTLKNSLETEITILNYGGIITSLKVADRNNEFKDVVLGFDSISQYLKNVPYFGAIIGRYANRVAKGKFTLDNKDYTLAKNNGENHLHGGEKGFDKVFWNAINKNDELSSSLTLTYLSKDMEEGYPGNLNIKVIYTLTDDNVLKVDYEAETDKKTIINLTQHSYFNLSGDFNSNILDHEVFINANNYLPVDDGLIPTGEIHKVSDTPFNFLSPKKIGSDIQEHNDQLIKGNGYDHSWIIDNYKKGLQLVASAYHQNSGRFLEVFSDQPAIQFYTGNFLNSNQPKKSGGTQLKQSGFCFETQHYPNSPNQKNFPSVILNPGEKYRSTTLFKFSIK